MSALGQYLHAPAGDGQGLSGSSPAARVWGGRRHYDPELVARVVAFLAIAGRRGCRVCDLGRAVGVTRKTLLRVLSALPIRTRGRSIDRRVALDWGT